ncbi:MAG: hypothetical protein AAGA56_19050 [Myxococcota bacterium]
MRNLTAVVRGEHIEAQQTGRAILPSGTAPSTAALGAFIRRHTDDAYLSDLVRAYALVPPTAVSRPDRAGSARDSLPPTWAVCMLAHRCIDPTSETHDEDTALNPTSGLVAALASGNGLDATRLAARRLQAAGARLRIGATPMTREDALRIAAALAFPTDSFLHRHAVRRATWTPTSAAKRSDAQPNP